jgi:hypothetical protein
MELQSLNNMCLWERKKAIYLMEIAENKLNMNLSNYGEIAVNQNSGYTYLWLEDYNFTLYMAINCDLTINDIYVLYSDLETGNETEQTLNNFDDIDHIYKWIEKIEDKNYQ